MKRLWSIACVAFCAVAQCGCANLSKPSWLHPGSAKEQQARAERFDPYPETNTGPTVEGARPREYETSPPEVDRGRALKPSQSSRTAWLPWNWGRTD
jgi:hypothetical protein